MFEATAAQYAVVGVPYIAVCAVIAFWLRRRSRRNASGERPAE